MVRKTCRFCLLLISLLPITLLAEGPIPLQAVTHLFDLKGDAAAPFALPTDVAVDAQRIYIVDGGNHRVVVFDREGRHLFSIGGKGSGDGRFLGPVGVGVDQKGRIYVADRGNRRIQVFNADGSLLNKHNLHLNDSPVTPIDVVPTPSGSLLFITGNNTHSVLRMREDGEILSSWGKNGVGTGQFRYPAAIDLMPEERVAVVDVFNTRVQIFSRQGEFSHEVGVWGVRPGQLFRPKGVAIDSIGRIYISDSFMNVVQVFDSTGEFLHVLGEAGEPKKMLTASGIAVDDTDRLYVAEMRNNRVSVYQLPDSVTGQ